MNTLAKLKTVCAAILRTSEASFTTGSTDLFLLAANNVRKNAELLHNFELTRLSATLDIDGETGGSLADAVIDDATARTAVVTGTLSPDATGTYTQTGLTLGVYPLYTKTTGTTFYLYYDGDDWIIDISSTSTSNCWALVGASGDSPTGSYTAVGTNTGTATVTGVDLTEFSGIKEIKALTTTRADGDRIPLDYASPSVVIERDRYEMEMSDFADFESRYPSDAQIVARGNTASIIQRGSKLYINPLSTVTEVPLAVNIEGYGWLNDYTATDLTLNAPSDFLIEHGFQFLQWAIVCEMNYIFQRFVPRQEGVLMAPEKARDEAWRNLLAWDTYVVDSNTTRSR